MARLQQCVFSKPLLPRDRDISWAGVEGVGTQTTLRDARGERRAIVHALAARPHTVQKDQTGADAIHYFQTWYVPGAHAGSSNFCPCSTLVDKGRQHAVEGERVVRERTS